MKKTTFSNKMCLSKNILDWVIFIIALVLGCYFSVEPILLIFSVLSPVWVFATLVISILLLLTLDYVLSSIVRFLTGLCIILGAWFRLKQVEIWPAISTDWDFISTLFVFPKQRADLTCLIIFLSVFWINVLNMCWHIGLKHVVFEILGIKHKGNMGLNRFIKEQKVKELFALQWCKFKLMLNVVILMSVIAVVKVCMGTSTSIIASEHLKIFWTCAFVVTSLPVQLVEKENTKPTPPAF